MQYSTIAESSNPVKLPKTPRGGTNYRQNHSFYEYIRQRDNYTCQLCGHYPSYEVDHIIPFAESHRTTPDNCRILCSLCNRQTRRERKDSRGFDPDPDSIGQQIKRMRLSLHLTQQEVANDLGLLQMHISRVETGMVNGYWVDMLLDYFIKRV